MRTKIKIVNAVLMIFTSAIVFSENIYAQCTTCFDAATVSHIPYSSGSTGVSNTGNEVRSLIGNNIFEVSVWDGSTPGLGWDYNFSGTPGTVVLGNGTVSDALDPDVCMVEYNGTAYALVVYYSPNQGRYYLEIFRWVGNAFVSNSLTVLQSSGCFGYTINIDSDDNNYFAIVWDKPSLCSPFTPASVYCITGNSVSGPPALDNSGTPVLINPNYRAKMPDVTVSYDGTNEEVLITYIVASGGNNGKMEVNYQLYSTLASGSICSSSCTLYNSAPTNSGVYSYPRISSIYYSSASELHWSVVLEKYDAGGPYYYIVGYTLSDYISFPSPGLHTYDDGNALIYSPKNIRNAANLRPAVSFDNTGDSIYIGWTFYNNGPVYNSSGATDANYPIVLHLNIKGELILVSSPSTYVNYWEVPNPLATGDDEQSLSIAGRYVNDNLYTFFGTDNTNVTTDVYYKSVTQSAPPLRKEGYLNSDVGEISFYPNPFSSSVDAILPGELNNKDISFSVTDISGKELYKISGGDKLIREKISLVSKELEQGIYIFKISSESNNVPWIKKLIKL